MGYIVAQDGNIAATEEAFLVPSIKSLYESDTGNEKRFFKESIKYIFLMADPLSPYINYIDSDKIINIRKEQFLYLSDEVFNTMISDNNVIVALEDYKDKHYDILERSWEGAKIKVDNFLKHLNNVPMEEEIEEKVVVEVGDGDDRVKKPVKIRYKRSNHDEYWKALKTYNEVLTFVKNVEQKIMKEIKENKRGRGKRRLFDSEKAQQFIKNHEIDVIYD